MSWFMRWEKRSGQGKRWRRRGQVYRLGWDDYKLGVLYERELSFPTLKNGRERCIHAFLQHDQVSASLFSRAVLRLCL